MSRRLLPAALVTAAFLTVTGSAYASQALCRGQKGKRVVDSLRIVVVDRTHRTTTGRTAHTYIACALSERPARIPASVPGGALRFGDRTDLYIVVRDVRTGRQSIRDLTTGTHHTVTVRGGRVLGDALVGSTGESAAIVTVGAKRRVFGFEADGTPYDLFPTTASRLHQAAGDHDALSFPGGTLHLDALPIPCARLRGKDIDADPVVKVVEVPISNHGGYGGDSFGYERIDASGTRLRGCVMPDGVARTLGEALSDDYSGAGVSLEAAAGHVALVSEQAGNSTGDFNYDVRTLVNLDTGSSRVIWGSGTEPQPNDTFADPGVFVLTPAGQTAAVFDASSVVAFGADAKPHTLDSGAGAIGAGLSLAGSVLRWTHGGQERTADLSPF